MSELAGAELVERALAAAQADATVVVVQESSAVNLRWAGSTLTTNGAARDRRITVISIVGRGFGVRSATTVTDLDELTALVRVAEEAARGASEAEDFGELVDGGTDAGFGAGPELTGTAVLEGFARDLGTAFDAASGDGMLLYGFASYELATTWLGTSAGTRRRHVQPTGSVEWNAKSGLPGGSVWHGQSTRDFTDVDVEGTVAGLATRLGWTSRQLELPAGRYETLLPPTAIADLLIYAWWTMAGRDAAEGRTVFSRVGGGTRIGEALAPAGLDLSSDPARPGLQVAPFTVATGSSAHESVFDNGLALQRTNWIHDGRLGALIETRAGGRERGVRATPPIDNLILDGGGTASLEDMVGRTERGLLLTCLWYIREVDPETLLLTGLTRDGVFLVEGGEVVGAVNNFRFNESPVDLLGRIAEVGAATRTLPREWSDYFTRAVAPTVRVPDFNMSSVSPAS